MAARDRQDQDLEPERRLARLLVERLDLAPPIDIRSVTERYADVEDDLIPANCDAVVVGLGGDRPRPLVVLARGKPWTRRRFSLAHELGHVLIPWHVGLASVCHLDLKAGGWQYRRDEAQANRFASEVLIPHRWVTAIVDSGGGVGEMLKVVAMAEVSASAACLSLARHLGPGHVLILETDGAIELVASSPGTGVNLPERGNAFAPELLTPFATERATFRIAGRRVEWWYFAGATVPKASADIRSSREIIDAILATTLPEARRVPARASIFAISGHAKGAYGAETVDALIAVLRQRFATRPQLAAVTEHKDFHLFLARRASELLDR